jgi:hypothetical protein
VVYMVQACKPDRPDCNQCETLVAGDSCTDGCRPSAAAPLLDAAVDAALLLERGWRVVDREAAAAAAAAGLPLVAGRHRRAGCGAASAGPARFTAGGAPAALFFGTARRGLGSALCEAVFSIAAACKLASLPDSTTLGSDAGAGAVAGCEAVMLLLLREAACRQASLPDSATLPSDAGATLADCEDARLLLGVWRLAAPAGLAWLSVPGRRAEVERDIGRAAPPPLLVGLEHSHASASSPSTPRSSSIHMPVSSAELDGGLDSSSCKHRRHRAGEAWLCCTGYLLVMLHVCLYVSLLFCFFLSCVHLQGSSVRSGSHHGRCVRKPAACARSRGGS